MLLWCVSLDSGFHANRTLRGGISSQLRNTDQNEPNISIFHVSTLTISGTKVRDKEPCKGLRQNHQPELNQDDSLLKVIHMDGESRSLIRRR